MILAAGLGTRLRPITNSIPKPLVPVVGIPNIVRTIGHLVRFGIREIVINVHHLGDVLMEYLGDGSAFGAAIEYSIEEELLGTGGGIIFKGSGFYQTDYKNSTKIWTIIWTKTEL